MLKYKKEKLLTVNIITYNHVKYIERCIKSILNQKTSFDYDIRIFDDGSTDGTKEICLEYTKKYPDKIKLYTSEKNMGLQNGILINALRSYDGIQTPYYLFIEGDDYRIGENGLEKQVMALENHPDCVFCGGNTLCLKNNKLCDEHPCYKEGIYTKDDVKNNPKVFFFINIAARIVRTSAISFNKDDPDNFLSDIKQLYTLIDKGNMYFLNDAVSVYNLTGEGIHTSLYILDRIQIALKRIKEIDDFTKREYTLTLVNFFGADVLGYLNDDLLKKEKNNANEYQNEPINEYDEKKVLHKINIKKLKKYIIPPFIKDIYNLPREIYRRIKQ